MNGKRLCTLHLATGRHEACPGATCAFWERGGAVVEPGCSFDRVSFELESRPDVSRWLLGIRATLEDARDAAETERARAAVNAFLPPGLHD